MNTHLYPPTRDQLLITLLLLMILGLAVACQGNSDDPIDGDTEDEQTDSDTLPDGDMDLDFDSIDNQPPVIDGDADPEVEMEADSDSNPPQLLCHPGEWECYDDQSLYRCAEDGQGYLDYHLCQPNEICEENACVARYPDGDVADGDVIDGDATDGDGTDGDVIDGDMTDGDATDGDIIDGDMSDGDFDLDYDEETGDPDLDPEPELEPEPDPEPEPEPEEDLPHSQCNGLTNTALWNCIRNIVTGHYSLGYDDAREKMFGDIDNVNGRVQCVYTGEWVYTWDIPSSATMNTEHSWPQSYGAGSEPARSDLNHLFPTISGANSARSNHPFGKVVSDINDNWVPSLLGDNANGDRVFEPRDEHKGDVARAVFYFAIRYDGGYSQVPWYDEALLKQWNRNDPPSDKEKARNDSIEHYQHRRNPFVDRPDFVDKISDFTRNYGLVTPPPPTFEEQYPLLFQ